MTCPTGADCYRVSTDGIGSSSEIELLVPPSGASSRRSRHNARSRTCHRQSFRALGVSAEVEHALAARDITSPFRIQSLVLAGRARGQRRAREVADRVGQDARLRRCRSSSAPTPATTPAALVLVPTRELALQVRTRSRSSPRRAAAGRDRLRRRPLGAQAKRCEAAHTSSQRPGGSRISIERADLARPRPDPGARRGRPDARHGLQAAGREDRPSHAARAARRCSSRPRSTARSAAGALSTRERARFEAERPRAASRREVEDTFVSVKRTRRSRRSVKELEREPRPRARLRPHEAGRGSARQTLSRRDVPARLASRRHVPVAQRERALARFRSARSRRSSRPTWRPAGSTSTDITHVINYDPPEDRQRATCTASAGPAAPDAAAPE